jgi:hypothetical protein
MHLWREHQAAAGRLASPSATFVRPYHVDLLHLPVPLLVERKHKQRSKVQWLLLLLQTMSQLLAYYCKNSVVEVSDVAAASLLFSVKFSVAQSIVLDWTKFVDVLLGGGCRCRGGFNCFTPTCGAS